MFRVFVGLAVVALSASGVAFAGLIGPSGTYYATDFYNYQVGPSLDAISGETIVTNPIIDPSNEGPIAIVQPITGPYIRTTGYTAGFGGGEYLGTPSLTVSPDGHTWTNNFGGYFFDGTSDGRSNYTVNYLGGDVVATDLKWGGTGDVIFNTGDSFYDWGITWDRWNNTLWIQNYVSGIITDYTMTGTPIFSFNTPDGYGAGIYGDTALAMDIDHTLWFERYTTGYLEHYATDGTYLGEVNYSGLGYAWGAEIATPVPGTFVMLSVLFGMFGLHWTHKRLQTSK